MLSKGERVELRFSTEGVPAGAKGTILEDSTAPWIELDESYESLVYRPSMGTIEKIGRYICLTERQVVRVERAANKTPPPPDEPAGAPEPTAARQYAPVIHCDLGIHKCVHGIPYSRICESCDNVTVVDVSAAGAGRPRPDSTSARSSQLDETIPSLHDVMLGGRASVFIADDEAASPVQETLNERERLYGNIEDLMTLSQEIQGVMRASKNWWKLMPAQREALQMIASKLARILNGDPNYKDNWHDIQGYARLAEERCKSSD